MLSLLCHPDYPAQHVKDMQASVVIDDDGHLALNYVICCPAAAIRAGKPKEPERLDSLWQTTCFELFAKIDDEAGYLEYNLAPTGDWATYQFTGYRTGMTSPQISPPRIKTEESAVKYSVEARIQLPSHYRSRSLQVALTAIIEEQEGAKSYWALAHGDGPADFHDPACFLHEVKAAGKV